MLLWDGVEKIFDSLLFEQLLQPNSSWVDHIFLCKPQTTKQTVRQKNSKWKTTKKIEKGKQPKSLIQNGRRLEEISIQDEQKKSKIGR